MHSDDDVVDKLQALLERDPDENVRADAAYGIGVSARLGAYDVLLEAAKRDP